MGRVRQAPERVQLRERGGAAAVPRAHTGVVGEEGGEEGVDVSGLFGGRLFDTVNAGPKVEAGSYRAIARALGVAEGEVLFLSDNVGVGLRSDIQCRADQATEVRAAREAGMAALVVDRPGNAPLSEQDRTELDVVTSFDDVKLQALVARPS